MASFSGILLCTAWYYTILAGFYCLYCPIIYIMFVNHRLYRNIADVLFSLWELYPVALFQSIYGTKLHHFGDYVNPDEKTIIVMNHRTRVDWNFVWVALYHACKDNSKKSICDRNKCDILRYVACELFEKLAGGKSKIKFVLKDELKNIPGIGWVMQLNYFLYVRRNWQEDKINLSQFVNYYNKLNYSYRLILFPEGTDLSEENRKKSDKYAHTNNLPNYQFVLHPRTTGWIALCSQSTSNEINSLKSVYDVTVAYDMACQTEMDLLQGRIPTHVYFHFKRYGVEDLPFSDEENLRTWLKERWANKEKSLRKFHNDGTFIDPVTNNKPLERPPTSLLKANVSFLFWTIVDISFTFLVLNSWIFRFWIIYHTLMFLFVTWYFGGFQNIQYKLVVNTK